MKFQIEMVMAIATIYDHDIREEEERRLCFIIAALGTINSAAKESAKRIGTKAFIATAQQYLKGATLAAVKELFKRVGITFTRKALEKGCSVWYWCRYQFQREQRTDLVCRKQSTRLLQDELVA